MKSKCIVLPQLHPQIGEIPAEGPKYQKYYQILSAHGDPRERSRIGTCKRKKEEKSHST